MDTTGRNGRKDGPVERPDMKRIAGDAARQEVRFKSFGEYLDWYMCKLGLSENRVADLGDVHVTLISRILSQDKPVGEGVMLRILVGLLGLSAAQLDFINAGLALGGDPRQLGVPGRHKVSSHEDYARRSRGGVRGVRYGNRTTEAAKARKSA